MECASTATAASKTLMLPLIALLILILFLSAPAFASQQLLALHGRANQNGSGINTGGAGGSGGDLRVFIYDANVNGNLIYDSGSDFNGTIVKGAFDVMLGSGTQALDLNYGQHYFLDLWVNGVDLNFSGFEMKEFEASHGIIYTGQIASQTLLNSNISPVANIDWNKVNKAGADLNNFNWGSDFNSQYSRKGINDTITGDWNFVNPTYFSGGWSSGGVTIQGGTVFAQNMVIVNDLNAATVTAIDVNGNYTPHFNNTYNLGSTSLRWAEVFSQDLNSITATINSLTLNSPLGIASGGTGGTSYAAGRVLFSNGSVLTSDGNFFWDNTNKRLGVGTSTPANALNLVGDLNVVTSASATPSLFINSSDGNVGIGTSSPIEKLYLKTTGRDLLRLEGNNDYIGVDFVDTGDTHWVAGINGTTSVGGNRPFQISRSNVFGTNDYLTISADGNVGIGTTTPLGLLHVATSGDVNSFVINNSSGNIGIGTPAPNYLSESNGRTLTIRTMASGAGYYSLIQGIANPQVDGRRIFALEAYDLNNSLTSNQGVGEMLIAKDGTPATNSGGQFMFNLHANGGSGMSTVMVIRQNGNVGINTTTPANKLNVVGDLNVATSATATPSLFVNSSDGNVGIGTTAPQNKLNVVGDLNVTGVSYLGNVKLTTNDINVTNVNAKDANIVFNGPTGTELARIVGAGLTSGNVGIGTATPSSPLHISKSAAGVVNLEIENTNATSLGTAIYLRGNGGDQWQIGNDILNNNGTHNFTIYDLNKSTARLHITGDGNVGIGTTAPSAGLEVDNGDIIHNKVRVYRNFIGALADGGGGTPQYYTVGQVILDQNYDSGMIYGRVQVGRSYENNETESFTLQYYITTLNNTPTINMATTSLASQNPLLYAVLTTNDNNLKVIKLLAYNNTHNQTFLYYDITSMSDNAGDSAKNPFKGSQNATDANAQTTFPAGTAVSVKRDSFNPSNGNNGFGLVNPSYTLDVNGQLRVFPTTGTGTTSLFTGSDGNVGIGTSSPAGLFHVSTTGNANSLVVNNSSGKVGIDLASPPVGALEINNAGLELRLTGRSGGVPAGIYTSSTSDSLLLTDWSSGTKGIDINLDNGNVGVGTASPGFPLQVYSTTADGINTYGWSHIGSHSDIGSGTLILGNTAANEGIISYNSYATFGDLYLDNTKDNASAVTYIRMRTAGTPVNAMTILGSGNVGIGTSLPGTILDVNQGSNSIGLRVDAGPGSISNPVIQLLRSDSTSATGDIQWVGSDSSVGWDIGVNKNVAGSFAIINGTTNANTALLIDSSKRVGINTTSPSYTLDVNGQLNVKTNSGTTSLFTDSSGNVGIGTTTPSVKLEVDANTSDALLGTYMTIKNTNADPSSRTASLVLNSVSGQFDLRAVGNGETFRIGEGATPTDYLQIGGNGSNTQGHVSIGINQGPDAATLDVNSGKLYVNSADGNVGIGTQSPSGLFHVSTTGNSNSLVVNNSSGRVGIGTSSPGQNLTVRVDQNNETTLDVINATNASNSDSRIDLAGGQVGTSNELTIVQYAPANNSTTLFNNNSSDMAVVFQNGDSTHGNGLIIGTSSKQGAGGTPIIFGTQTSERMRIGGDGNVGIGTQSPSGLFHVSTTGNSNSLVVNNGSGNVGIGTNAPTNTLSVHGATDPSSVSYGGGQLQVQGSGGNTFVDFGRSNALGVSWIQSQFNNVSTRSLLLNPIGGNVGVDTNAPTNVLNVLGDLNVSTSGTQFAPTLYANASGTVGIGTTGTTYKLDVNGQGRFFGSSAAPLILQDYLPTSYTSLRLYNDQGVGSRALEEDYAGSSFSGSLITNGPTGESGAIYTTGAYPLAFGANGSRAMTIGSDNNVGVGTASPVGLFHVSTTGNSNSLVVNNSSGNVGVGTASPTSILHVNGAGPIVKIQATAAGQGEQIQLLEPTSSGTKFNWMIGAQQNVDNAFEITPSTAANGTTFSTPAILLRKDGNVGIGASAPAGLFHVSTTGNSNSLVVNNSSGNVGVGTSSPSSTLDVHGSNGGGRLRFSNDDSNYGLLFTGSSGGLVATHLGTGTNVPLGFFVNSGSDSMVINTSGNVGIGTSSPKNVLNVVGDLNVVTSATAAPTLFANTSGKVGVSTSSPTALLNVNGENSNATVFEVDANSNGSPVTGIQVDANGAVGIGTTAANGNASLSVTRNFPDGSSVLVLNGGATSTGYRLIAKDNGTNVVRISQHGSVYIDQEASNSDTALIVNAGGGSNNYAAQFNGGNVGVGVTAPSVKLDVNGNISLEGAAGDTSNVLRLYNTDNGNFAFMKNNASGTGSTAIAFYISGNSPDIVFGHNSAHNLTVGIGAGSNSPNSLNVVGDLNVVTSATAVPSLFVNSSDGNVGIGTASPAQKLKVAGTMGVTGTNVYIGTDQTATLIMPPTFGGAIRIRGDSGSLSDRKLQLGGVDNTGTFTSVMTVGNADAANVGIGTTTPTNKLTVFGDVNISSGGLMDSQNSTGACSGRATLSSGGATVATTCFANASDLVLVTPFGGGKYNASYGVGEATAGTGFDINSSLATDANTVNWFIVRKA